MILWTGWQRFRYWRSWIGFECAYYKIKHESGIPICSYIEKIE